ncbi:MAG: ATP-binding protein, partial [Treponema sp.]|nr:ATP-binding protein [Treponema sp.]
PAMRRQFIDEIMNSVIISNERIYNIYSVWKPNELDNLDNVYANSAFSDETGQYMSGLTRERGWVEKKRFTEYMPILSNGDTYFGLSRTGVLKEPGITNLGNRSLWLVEVQIPIIMKGNGVGFLGLTINMDQLQYRITTLRPFNTGRVMVVTNRGLIIAHKDMQLRGLHFPGYNNLEPLLSVAYEYIMDSINSGQQLSFSTEDELVVIYPLRITDAITGSIAGSTEDSSTWTVISAVPLATIYARVNELVRFSIFFLLGAAVVIGLVVLGTSRSLTRQADLLQRNLERATAMQNNLKYGLFLMDKKYIIQDAYTKALDNILSISELQGKVFLEILSSSLKTKELDGLSDYFEMIFSASLDKELLDSVNPINVFSYTSNDTKEVKSLRTTFTLAEGTRGSEYILGTVEDITAEKELEKQLIEAQMGREKEMQFLFQVIQLNPRVLSDFIEDTEYEFDKVNDLLKNKTHFHREVLVEIYQSIHAVKSNALILNLETFSKKLHVLESSIRNLQEKYEDFVPFDDFLGLVLELDESLKEKDQIKEAVSKIQNFKSMSGEEKDQERFILIETLTQICNKTQAALNKKVKLVVESIDEAVLDHGPRRVIKEVLTQLVRNAVYHGIEMPDERESLGKNPEGEIRVSMRYKDNQIIIKLTDNGKGINFEKIRNTAETFNLFSNPEEANDTNYLLQLLFSPGFSTLDAADLHAGRGMGLNLVRDRIKEIHGNLKVSTAPGRGTTFTILIPMETAVLVESAGKVT